MEHFGGTIYRNNTPNIGKGYYHQWNIVSLQAGKVLRAILPFLVMKTAQAEVALNLLDLMAGQRKPLSDADVDDRLVLVQEIRSFNSRPKAARVPIRMSTDG